MKRKRKSKNSNWRVGATLVLVLLLGCFQVFYCSQEVRDGLAKMLSDEKSEVPRETPKVSPFKPAWAVVVIPPSPVPTASPILVTAPLIIIPSPTPKPPDPLAWILDHKAYCPKEVALREDMSFPVISEGVKVGFANIHADKLVQVVEILLTEGKVIVSCPVYGNAPVTLGIDSTDLLERAKSAMAQAESDAKAPPGNVAIAPPSVKTTAPSPTPPEQSPVGDGSFTDLPSLSTSGRQIVDNRGNPVLLQGVNIGGWLVTEAWMCGEKNDCGRGALELLEGRFGSERAANLMKAWQDNWFTAQDLDRIQSYGFNMIRVPFSNRNFQNAKGEWIRDSNGNIDFSRLDWVVREASKRKIYVVLDFHVWPRQIEKDNYGLPSRLSDEGKAVRDSMAEVWRQIARHFRGVGTIAGFDVINEPEGSPGDAPHHAFYDAIRAEDPQRMVIIEWVSYPDFLKTGWKNVVWSPHYPEETMPESAKDATLEERLAAFDKKEKISASSDVQVPIYVGEAKALNDDETSAAELASAFNKRGWSWSIWTYKAINVGGWASFNYNEGLRCDLVNDSYEDILKKWTEGLSKWQTNSQTPNYWFTDWWVKGFHSPREDQTTMNSAF